MKKIIASLAAVLLAVSLAAPVNACVDANGNPVKGVDGSEANSTEGCIRPEIETEDHFRVEEDTIDFGRVTELDRSYTKTITIINYTGADVIIDVEAEKEGDSAMVDWVAFVGGATHFTVNDGATRSLGVRAYVPSDVTAGSQYTKIKISDANGYEVEVLAKLDIANDGFKYNSEVTDSWVNPINLGEKNVAGAKVKNTGNAGFAATYEIKKKNFFGGMDWDVLSTDEQEVKPGSEVEFKDESQLGYGVFNVEQRVTFVNSDGRIIESKITRIVINMPIWLLFAIGGVIILIVVLVIVIKKCKKNKNRKKDDDEEEKPAEKKEADDEGDDEIAEIAEKLEEDGEKITVHIRD